MCCTSGGPTGWAAIWCAPKARRTCSGCTSRPSCGDTAQCCAARWAISMSRCALQITWAKDAEDGRLYIVGARHRVNIAAQNVPDSQHEPRRTQVMVDLAE